jgi:hypothetical protein
MMLQMYRRHSQTENYKLQATPFSESGYSERIAHEELQKAGVHPAAQARYDYIVIQFEEGEDLPKELTTEQAEERRYRP